MTAGWVRPDWGRERSGLKGLMDARGGIRFVLVLEHYRHSQPLPTATCSAGSGLWLGTLMNQSIWRLRHAVLVHQPTARSAVDGLVRCVPSKLLHHG